VPEATAAAETRGDGDHALVVGGSGMLAGLCRRLAGDGWQVTVVGRDQRKLGRATVGDPRLHPLSVDYEDVAAFAAALDAAVAARRPIRLAVCWVRSWAPQSLLVAAGAIAVGGRLFHIVSSRAGNASTAAVEVAAARAGLRYRQVQLGAVADGTERRWLTNDEISAGVYAAVIADRPYHLVGTVAP
jgi:NAD(P)-dependent dehydrogenase (short-subunit alcohol dehydrogenase family)